jgi:phosphoribosylformylglycinamidine synthase
LGTIAGLDNFCWPDPVQSEKTVDGEFKLGQLVRCCEGLHDVCVAFGIPLISGKDSMKNDYKIGDTKISIPPTVLFTAVGVVEDVTRCVSMDGKRAGDAVFVLGDTHDELGGSEYFKVLGESGGDVPRTDPAFFAETYRRINAAIDAGLIASCHDCSDGGLAVALAETAMAGALGMTIDLSAIGGIGDEAALFSESQGRFVITVSPEFTAQFEQLFEGAPCYRVGATTGKAEFIVTKNDTPLVNLSIAELKGAWQGPLKW